jgi:hypothetical protein
MVRTMSDDDVTAEELQRHVELGDERRVTAPEVEHDPDHGQCVVALVVGALAGAATGIGIGMVVGTWLL